MKSKALTVVMHYTDYDKFKGHAPVDKLFELFKDGDTNLIDKGGMVTAMSRCDEIEKLERIEELLASDNYDIDNFRAELSSIINGS